MRNIEANDRFFVGFSAVSILLWWWHIVKLSHLIDLHLDLRDFQLYLKGGQLVRIADEDVVQVLGGFGVAQLLC